MGGHIRRPLPNLGPLQNRTRPYSKQLPAPFKPLNPVASSTRTSSPGSSLAEGTGPREEQNEDTAGTSVGTRVPSSYRPASKAGYLRRQQLYGGHSSPRHPDGPKVGKPVPVRHGPAVRNQTHLNTTETKDDQSGEPDTPVSTRGEQSGQSGEQDHVEVFPKVQTGSHKSSIGPEPNRLEGGDNVQVQATKHGTKGTRTPDSNWHLTDAGGPSRVRPSKLPRPVHLPTKTQTSPSIRGSQRLSDGKTEPLRSPHSKPSKGSDVPSSGSTRELLENVGVTNRTSRGFALTWDSPHRKYKNFVVTSKQKTDEDHEEAPEAGSEHGAPEGAFRQVPGIPGGPTANLGTGRDKTFREVLPGSARSFQFEDLPPQTEYTVTLLGKGPGLLSRLHKLVISTGTRTFHCCPSFPGLLYW